jgi:Flp pilus assembly protein TadD
MTDRRVLSFQPESGFYHKRAIKSIDKADFTTALKNLRKAVEMEPENLSYRLDLADAYARMGLYERSNLEIQLMFHLKEMPTEALYGMGSNYMAMGDYDQAETMLRAYLKVEPEGEFADQADDALDYIADCDYETELDRELDELSMDGKAALDAGDLDHAVDCLERALQKDPSMAYVRNNLAVAYYCIGDMDKAWAQLNQVLEQDPLDAHGRCNESMFLLADGKKEEAARALSKLRLERIEEIDELFKYCLALADLGLDEQLAQALKKIFLTCPYDTSMLYLWGVCQYNQGKYQESLRTFEKLSVTEPGSLLAAYGSRVASQAVRDGAPSPERLPYTFDLPKEMEDEVAGALDALLAAPPEDIREKLEDGYTQALVRAALTGTESQMGQAVLLLGFAAGPVAERMLREVLLSPTHSTFFKQMVLDTLRTMKAPEPFYSLQDGKLVLVRSRRFEFDKNLPRGYIRVMRDAVNRMAEKYNDEKTMEYVAGLWAAYIMALDGHYPKLTNEPAWVMALDGLYQEDHGQQADWARLAAEAGCTQRTLLLRKNKLIDASAHLDEGRGGTGV